MLPRISVITPSYNQADFLEECITSVLQQNYPNLEYIVIDGASTDGSEKLIRNYEAHLSYWTSEPDKGQSQAINKGLKRATDDIVCWLNSDDYFHEGALARVSEAWLRSSDKNKFWCIGDAHELDEATGQLLPNPSDRDCSVERLTWGHRICQPASFWSRALDLYLDESLHYAMDWELCVRIAHKTRAVFLSEYLAVSRLYESTNTSTGGRKMADEYYRVCRKYGNKPIVAWTYRYMRWELSYRYRQNPNPKSITFRAWSKLNHRILPWIFGPKYNRYYMWDFFT